ncbi:MAG TPA: hypothetical protein VHT73_17630 [Thermodesulfobacteriota bacterium]|nr:hypothetical protein [Thermodesulfobacteriota bacterium]
MIDELPEPLATLKREHDNEKEKLFKLKEEIKILKNIQYDFRERCQRSKSERHFLIHRI